MMALVVILEPWIMPGKEDSLQKMWPWAALDLPTRQ